MENDRKCFTAGTRNANTSLRVWKTVINERPTVDGWMLPRFLGVVRPGVKPECICVDTFPGERLRFRSTTLDEVSFLRGVQELPRFARDE